MPCDRAFSELSFNWLTHQANECIHRSTKCHIPTMVGKCHLYKLHTLQDSSQLQFTGSHALISWSYLVCLLQYLVTPEIVIDFYYLVHLVFPNLPGFIHPFALLIWFETVSSCYWCTLYRPCVVLHNIFGCFLLTTFLLVLVD